MVYDSRPNEVEALARVKKVAKLEPGHKYLIEASAIGRNIFVKVEDEGWDGKKSASLTSAQFSIGPHADRLPMFEGSAAPCIPLELTATTCTAENLAELLFDDQTHRTNGCPVECVFVE